MNVINTETNASYGFVAPNIPADGDKKNETVFPTAETVTAVFDENNESTVDIVRERTLIYVPGEQGGMLTINLKPDARMLNKGALVAVVVPGEETTNLDVMQGNDNVFSLVGFYAEVTKALVAMWDGEKFVPVTAAVSTSVSYTTLNVRMNDSHTGQANLKMHETYVNVTTELSADSNLITNPNSLKIGSRVIVGFACGAVAYDLEVSGGANAITLAGTANTRTVKELVWNGSGFDVIG